MRVPGETVAAVEILAEIDGTGEVLPFGTPAVSKIPLDGLGIAVLL